MERTTVRGWKSPQGLDVSVFKLAWRNVWRNHRRTGITIAAMTLALVLELLYSGMVAGLVRGMEDDVVEFDLGDIQVLPEGYLTRPSLYDTVPGSAAILDELTAAVLRATPRLYGGGLAGAGEASSGVQLVGLDPVRDADTLALSTAIAEGGQSPAAVVVPIHWRARARAPAESPWRRSCSAVDHATVRTPTRCTDPAGGRTLSQASPGESMLGQTAMAGTGS